MKKDEIDKLIDQIELRPTYAVTHAYQTVSTENLFKLTNEIRKLRKEVEFQDELIASFKSDENRG